MTPLRNAILFGFTAVALVVGMPILTAVLLDVVTFP
jgi:hypothetical protein